MLLKVDEADSGSFTATATITTVTADPLAAMVQRGDGQDADTFFSSVLGYVAAGESSFAWSAPTVTMNSAGTAAVISTTGQPSGQLPPSSAVRLLIGSYSMPGTVEVSTQSRVIAGVSEDGAGGKVASQDAHWLTADNLNGELRINLQPGSPQPFVAPPGPVGAPWVARIAATAWGLLRGFAGMIAPAAAWIAVFLASRMGAFGALGRRLSWRRMERVLGAVVIAHVVISGCFQITIAEGNLAGSFSSNSALQQSLVRAMTDAGLRPGPIPGRLRRADPADHIRARRSGLGPAAGRAPAMAPPHHQRHSRAGGRGRRGEQLRGPRVCQPVAGLPLRDPSGRQRGADGKPPAACDRSPGRHPVRPARPIPGCRLGPWRGPVPAGIGRWLAGRGAGVAAQDQGCPRRAGPSRGRGADWRGDGRRHPASPRSAQRGLATAKRRGIARDAARVTLPYDRAHRVPGPRGGTRARGCCRKPPMAPGQLPEPLVLDRSADRSLDRRGHDHQRRRLCSGSPSLGRPDHRQHDHGDSGRAPDHDGRRPAAAAVQPDTAPAGGHRHRGGHRRSLGRSSVMASRSAGGTCRRTPAGSTASCRWSSWRPALPPCAASGGSPAGVGKP